MNPGFTASGLQNGQTVAMLTGLSNSFGITSNTPVGNATLTVIGTLTNANYTIDARNSGTWTVTLAGLTITANDQSKTYGTALNLGTSAFTVSGTLYDGDSVTAVTLSSPGAVASANVAGSPYTITASNAVGSRLSNYTITYVAGKLTVDQAPLTITANDRSKAAGMTLDLGTSAFTVTGTLYDGDTVTAVTLTSAGAAASATVAGSPYPITPSNAIGSEVSNYAITYFAGELSYSCVISAKSRRSAGLWRRKSARS